MATYHWGTGHFRQYHFNAYHWGGVLVPAPVISGAPPRGGGGVWPWWRLEENQDVCKEKDWVKENSKKIRKKLATPDALGAAQKKKEAANQEAKAREIRRINREINGLKKNLTDTKKGQEELERLQAGLEKLQGNFESGSLEQAQLKETIRGVADLTSILTQRVVAIEKKLAEDEKLRETEVAESVTEPAHEVIETTPVAEELAFLQAYKDSLVGRLKAAFPWALGAGATYLGTRYLVPEKMSWLKFTGYAGTTALSLVAVFRFLDIDLGLDWLWPSVASPQAEPQV